MKQSEILLKNSANDEIQSALYKGIDSRLYQIITLDSDTAIMCSADGKKFTVAAKPYLDESDNVIDFSSKEDFRSLSEAKKFSKELHLLFEAPQRVIDSVAEIKARTRYEPVRVKKKLIR